MVSLKSILALHKRCICSQLQEHTHTCNYLNFSQLMMLDNRFNSSCLAFQLPGLSQPDGKIYVGTAYTRTYYRIPLVCRVPRALGKAINALGQRLCRVPSTAYTTRQPKTHQRCFCRVLFLGHSAKLCGVLRWLSAKKKLGRRPNNCNRGFAEGQGLGTRQRFMVCRVSGPWHSANNESLPSVFTLTLGKVCFQNAQISGLLWFSPAGNINCIHQAFNLS